MGVRSRLAQAAATRRELERTARPAEAPLAEVVPISGRPRHALTASARTIAVHKIRSSSKEYGWQDEAFALYDQTGELRYVSNAICNAMSKAELYIGKKDRKNPKEWPKVEDAGDPGVQALDALFGDNPHAEAQFLRRIGKLLFTAGEGWYVGTVQEDPQDGYYPVQGPGQTNPVSIPPTGPANPAAVAQNTNAAAQGGLPVDGLDWNVHARGELTTLGDQLKINDRIWNEDEVIAIRIWNPHPRLSLESDSPLRSSMPVCRELVGFTMKNSADIDSRLAGAGAFFIPNSATVLGSAPMEQDTQQDPFVAALLEHMITPIKDPDSAARVAPLVITLPDDMPWMPFHLSFATKLDDRVGPATDQTIRRLALGLDAPPERLLGMGDANHWSAWQLSEDEVKLHVEPPLELVCDALTTQYIRVALAEAGVPDWRDYAVLADTTKLVLRPDRSADGFQLYDRFLIDAGTLRDVTGFEDSDSPGLTDDPVILMALGMVKDRPDLMAAPGLPVLIEEIRAALAGLPGPYLPTMAQGKEDATNETVAHEAEGNSPKAPPTESPASGTAPDTAPPSGGAPAPAGPSLGPAG